MTAIEMNEPELDCPTSGPMLRALIHAFQLSREGAPGADVPLVGSATEERNDRRYLDGRTVVPDDVRQRIAAKVATALTGMGLADNLRLPPQSGYTSVEGAITAAVSNWTKTWDKICHQCSVGWPYIPRSLGTFILGREVVIDLALRVSAFIHLRGGAMDDCLVHAAREDAGARILCAALGRDVTYVELARMADVDRRTAQRWLNESLTPQDYNLRQLASTKAGTDQPREYSLLRYLRVQYGMLRLSQLLESLCRRRWTDDLMQAFERILNCAVFVTQEIGADPGAFNSNAEGVDLAQVELLTKGTGSNMAPAVISLWLQRSHPAIWAHEMHLAASMTKQQRLERCFRIVGNWPQFWAGSLPDSESLGLSAMEHQTRLESVALTLLCPPLREKFEGQPPTPGNTEVSPELEQLIHRAGSLQNEGRELECLPLWRQVIKQAPGNAEHLCNYGIALRTAGQRSEALDMLRSAADLEPLSDRPHIEIARTYLQQGVPDLALHYLESLSAGTCAGSVELLWVKAELLYLEGRYADALSAAEESLTLDPDNADTHDLAARCLVRMPQTRENRETAARHAKQAASGHRVRGLNEWQNTKRRRSG